MAKCGDCLYFGFCKKYIDPEETFPEIGGCTYFKNKDAFVEVIHGQWKPMQFKGQNDRRTMEYFCSECQTLGSPQWKCCPVCMARMDGGNEDAQQN